METEGKACRAGGRNWNESIASRGMPGSASSYQKLGERQGMDFSLEPPEGTKPADSLISGYLACRIVRD